MLKSHSIGKLRTPIAAVCLLAFAGLACKSLSIWIRGPRATKYFWADPKGNLSDHE